jgi:putative MFS transporter
VLRAVLVAALGYFVDIYDLILFSVVRVKSLTALGLRGSGLLDDGVTLINAQMIGMLVGGVLWGVLGDRKGRISVLYASIVTYSLANLANGFVQSVGAYAALRFIAGVGLAGELGAGITLVTELMSPRTRGWGTTIVATVGLTGAVVAALVADAFDWRTAYFIGGAPGHRAAAAAHPRARERDVPAGCSTHDAPRGSVAQLFSPPARALKYLSVIAVGLPIWFAVGILVTFAPEFGAALHMTALPAVGTAVLWCYVGLALGDLSAGALSQTLRSRRKVVGIFLASTVLATAAYFLLGPISRPGFYACCFGLGLANGYWALFVSIAAESFGTNVRATVATTVPNFVRGALVPMTLAFKYLRAPLGVVQAALVVGAVTVSLAFLALRNLPETYGREMDYLER